MQRWTGFLLGSVLAVAVGIDSPTARAALPAPAVTFSTVATDGYFTGGINSVAPNKNNFALFGNYEFVAFYDSRASAADPASVKIGRRAIGSTDWTVIDTGRTPGAISDDHDTVAIAVDGAGRLHMSWGMHNNPMNYVISTTRVDGPSFVAPTFATPAAWANRSDPTHNLVTYPELYKIPGSDGDLLFTYRQGGTGGGSGNGDQYYVRYHAATGTFDSKNKVINGQADSVNAYQNTLAYTSTGELFLSWTWRDTPQFQSNHNLMFARSADDGLTWTRQDGTPFTLPITRGQGGIIADIPQGSTLINQASMTVDGEDHPLIATWYAPGTAQGDFTRQYMLHWFDGETWQVSQITQRPREPLQSDATVRDLARPIVLVEEGGRTLVVMRYKEAGNGIVVAVSEDRRDWEFITLSTTNMGDWEPTYDAELWRSQNKLALFFQPLGSVGNPTVRVLDWDARAYFASIPEPGGVGLALAGCLAGLLRRRRTA